MFLLNPHAARRPYDAELRQLLNLRSAHSARERLSAWPLLSAEATPAWALPGLARVLGVAGLTVKDESTRSSLGSFKALGAPNALVELILRRWPQHGWTAADLLAGRHAGSLKAFVVTSATDGNHGRALAAAAQCIGCRCVIVLHARVRAEREQAIAAFGAEIVRVPGNYDASVDEAARLARANGWEVVSDTSYQGYEAVPRDVMQGYGVIAAELLENLPEAAPCPWTHVILQGGVGGLAAGVASCIWECFGARRPRFVVVEPEQADCLYQSAVQGRPASATGSVDSVMAGLACGEASPLAWRFLQPAIDVFMTVTDAQAVEAMRVLADGRHGDVPMVAGESGAAGLAALQALSARADWREAAGLDAGSRVLLINTEGATAPGVFAALVGQSADAVLDAQQTWLAGRASALTFRQAVPEDAARCFQIESTAYEGDEAATLWKISKRIAEYPRGFLIMELQGRIVGFINSGCAHAVVMSDESFKELVGHDPSAPNVVIMSVVIEPACQGRGYASVMMRTFVEQMRQAGKKTIHLMCKDRHVALYERQGYGYVRPSSSDHGGMAWHEMVMAI
jgi:diaminopropionate ammonia-lyase family